MFALDSFNYRPLLDLYRNNSNPHGGTVTLLVDDREVQRRVREKGERDAARYTQRLREMLRDVPCDIENRTLNLGDFMWIYKKPDGTETVLNCIAERKTRADLDDSFKDGRWEGRTDSRV
eukprot:GEZU01011939.1.p1 GENE.GEZU01011939.1~~GEZU01011939.1.p1  ORF type:complete len:120 (-),score=11.30 GEZU01011939.1:83-442(-)